MGKASGPRKASAALEIQQLAADLAIGEDGRFVCPNCGGGSTNERSLSIFRKRPHNAGYTCWRASCDLGSGMVSLIHDDKKILNGYNKNTNVKKKSIAVPGKPLSPKARKWLKRHFNLTDELLAYAGVSEHGSDGRIIYVIFGPRRHRRGCVLRAYKHLYKGHREFCTIPKALNVVDDPKHPSTSWYYRGRHVRKQTNTLVIVEDIVSALRLNPYTDSLALCGTIFSAARQMEVKRANYDRIYLALDNDATRTASKIVKNCKLTLPKLKVKFLPKDVKDMGEDELKAFIAPITEPPNE